MSETNDRFGSGRSIAEKLQADVLEVNENTVFVQYDPEDCDIEPRTPMNRLLFETDDDVRETIYDFIVYGEAIGVDSGTRSARALFSDDTATSIDVVAKHGGEYFELQKGDVSTPMPPEFTDDVLIVLVDYLEGSLEDEDAFEQFDEMRERVEAAYADRSVVGAFLDRYEDGRIETTARGWVVDDTFIVTYDGGNYLVDDPGVTYEQRHGGVERVEYDHPYVDLDLELEDDDVFEMAPDGSPQRLGQNEQQFLATVEALLHPDRYLGHDMAGRVVDEKQARSDTDFEPSDAIEQIASSASDEAFKDTEGQIHDHSLEKHTLSGNLNVTDEAIERLHHQQNGHVGVHEFVRRESEFRNAEFDVFEDAPNNADAKWAEAKESASSAPIADETRRRLDRMFGGVR